MSVARLTIAHLVAACLAAPAAAHAGTPTGAQIMEAVENRDDGKTQINTVSLEIRPAKGTKRVRRFALMRKEYPSITKLVTFFQAPADVRNSALLVWDRRGVAPPSRRCDACLPDCTVSTFRRFDVLTFLMFRRRVGG